MLQFGMSLQMPQASLLVLPGNFDLGECYLIWVYIVLKLNVSASEGFMTLISTDRKSVV